MSILYIDDDRINTELFYLIFSKKYNVICGLSGKEGLDILDKNPDIQIVITDMKMPEMNGLEFLKNVKNKHKNKYCFILTGYGLTNEIKKAIDSGLLIQCFGKPFNKREITDNIDRLNI